jgi:hypothetical protein
MKTKLFFTLVLGLISCNIFSQTYTLSNNTANTGFASYATTCSGTFVDNGGSLGNYIDGSDASYTFFPATAGQYIQLTFTVFNTQPASDYLAIYDGPAGPLLGTYSGLPGLFTVTASTSNATRGLTCRFHANGSTNNTGWSATISCVGTGATPPAFTVNAQDCQQGGGTTVCANTSLTANSSGDGNINDLPNPMNGCLAGENQSSWYYFSPSSSGNIGFTIAPANGTDDYDFAVWGPFTTVSCPVNLGLQPIRCSWSDLSEGSGGNKWVQSMAVIAGQVYVMVIDNFSSSSNPFTLSWQLGGGASLNCTVLPIELISFTGERQDNYHALKWQTASELNNDYFTIERSVDGEQFESIGQMVGAGTSMQMHAYSFNDLNPGEGWNYYRIRQTDYNGQSTISTIVALNYHSETELVKNIHPVPANGEVSFDFITPGAGGIQYQLTDCTGRIVYDQKAVTSEGKNTVKISLQDNEPGIYFLRVMNPETNFFYVTKIIVE